MGLFTGSKTKRIAKELSETRKLLEQESRRAAGAGDTALESGRRNPQVPVPEKTHPGCFEI